MNEARPGDKAGGKIKAVRPALADLNGTSAGTDLAACVIVGLVLGYLCQRFLPWSRPWGFLSLLFLGIAAGFWQLFKSQAGGPKEKK